MIKKVKRLFLLMFLCRISNHTGNKFYFNGFKKGTSQTSIPICLFQKKCTRCNRFYGKKERAFKKYKTCQ